MNSLAHNIKIVIKGDVQVYGTFPGDAVPLSLQDGELLGEITQQKPEITFNTNRTSKSGKKAPDGIEIRFGSSRPTEATRQVLKDHGFQFSEKQTIWYALDNAESRKLVEQWTDAEVEVDTTQYVKQHFWARVRNVQEYGQLREYTEFWVNKEPAQYFYNKNKLQNSYHQINALINDGLLYFKKFYNKAVDEEEGEEPGSEPNHTAIAEKLQALADGMQKEIDAKINSATSRQPRTAKRVRVAAGLREEGHRLQDIQTVLYALSEAHSNDTIKDFSYLQNIRTKSQVELLNRYTRFIQENWSQDSIDKQFEWNREALQKLGITSVFEWNLATVEKAILLQQSSTSQQQRNTEQERQIKELEDKVWRMNIPGFFPTPSPLIERMLQLADIQPNQSILEPSAGKGDILDAVVAKFQSYGLSLYAAEINAALQEILIIKGYTLRAGDFMQMMPINGQFDRILMNPPFEGGQDVDHVNHALELLLPGGRLVAIMSEGVFYRSFKKDVAFRKLLQEKNAYISEPVKDAFKNAFNTANINVRIVAINADGSPIQTSQPSEQPVTTAEASNENDDLELLELEAEAELELLKMRVELERKRKQRPIEGIPAISQDKLQRFRQKAWALQDNVEILDFN